MGFLFLRLWDMRRRRFILAGSFPNGKWGWVCNFRGSLYLLFRKNAIKMCTIPRAATGTFAPEDSENSFDLTKMSRERSCLFRLGQFTRNYTQTVRTVRYTAVQPHKCKDSYRSRML